MEKNKADPRRLQIRTEVTEMQDGARNIIIHESDNQPTWEEYLKLSPAEPEQLIKELEAKSHKKTYKEAVLHTYTKGSKTYE